MGLYHFPSELKVLSVISSVWFCGWEIEYQACSFAGERLPILHTDILISSHTHYPADFFFRPCYQWLDLPWESSDFLILRFFCRHGNATSWLTACKDPFPSVVLLHPASIHSCFQCPGKSSYLSLSFLCHCESYCGSLNAIKDPFWHCDPQVDWMEGNGNLITIWIKNLLGQSLLEKAQLCSSAPSHRGWSCSPVETSQCFWRVGRKLDEASSSELSSSLYVRHTCLFYTSFFVV